MIVQSSNILLSSQHAQTEGNSKEVTIRFWSNAPQQENQSPSVLPVVDTLELSDEAKSMQTRATEDMEKIELSPEDKMKIKMIQTLLEALSGRKFEFNIMEKVREKGDINLSLNQGISWAGRQGQTRGWGMEISSISTHYEYEEVGFSAKGEVKTADGRVIKLNADFFMSRDYWAQQKLTLRAGDAPKIDPLIINFEGSTASLTDTRVRFDLNADGMDETIAFAGSGSGFLALDRNGDGQINDGSELFGPSSGNGFSELAAFDQDGNSWIDENDEIYFKLRLWTKDNEGKDGLFSLHEKGIGAIYLGTVETQFKVTDVNNQELGQMRRSSIYLSEDGGAGFVQQIDLTA